MRRLLFIALAALFAASCRTTHVPVKPPPPPVVFDDDSFSSDFDTKPDTLNEVKINMTLKKLTKMAADSGLVNLRAAKDGVFHIKWIADNFPQQKVWFFDSLCNHQEAFLKTVYPFDSLWRAGKLKFTRVVAKGNFNCRTSGMEALDCSWDKIMKVAFANGAQPDYIHVFSYNNGFGTGNGGISVTGVGNESLLTSPWVCPYWIREPKITIHEMGHGMGCDHCLIPTCTPNFMSQATNGGCEIGNIFMPQHQQIILNFIKSRIN